VSWLQSPRRHNRHLLRGRRRGVRLDLPYRRWQHARPCDVSVILPTERDADPRDIVRLTAHRTREPHASRQKRSVIESAGGRRPPFNGINRDQRAILIPAHGVPRGVVLLDDVLWPVGPAGTQDHAAAWRDSRQRSQTAVWFQLAKFWLTSLRSPVS
jgi:hypothetical protein